MAGVPKACLAGPDGELCPGTIIPLSILSSGRTNFVLCAHVSGHDWYCRSGSFEASRAGAPTRGCLDEAGLVIEDLVADSCDEEHPSKRMKHQAPSFQLRGLIDSSPDAWRALVAIATFKAESKRSTQSGRRLTWNEALASFESDPWRWEAVEGTRASHVRFYFLWTWRDAGSVISSYELTAQHLNHLLAGSNVPPPGGLQLRGRTLWANLLAYAQEQARRTLCPCRYLGARVASGKYEPDPSLWDSATSESRSASIVCFAREHITVGPRKKPHVVGITVHDALHHHRPPPRWPLRSRNEWLNFAVEWLNPFAELKKPGIVYHGVSYEHVERPDIVQQLPKGGVDIQDVPRFWDFPSGQCSSYSILQLRGLPEDQLLAYDSDEAYLEMAKQFR